MSICFIANFKSFKTTWIENWQILETPDYLSCIMLSEKPEAYIQDVIHQIQTAEKEGQIKEGKIISQIKLDVPTYSKRNLPNFLKKIPITKPGSRFLR